MKWNTSTKVCKNGKHTILYTRWSAMKRRCNPNSTQYNTRFYRENNIKICDEWLNYDNFVKWALNNGYRDDLSLDRIDEKKDYCPENCQWISMKENVTKRNLKYDYTKMKSSRKVINLDTNEEFDSIAEAAKKYSPKGNPSHIQKCCSGISEKAYGYRWSYRED